MKCDSCDGTIKPKTRLHYIGQLRACDIFFATSSKMPCMVCVVDNIDGDYIKSRVVTTQIELCFGRENGQADYGESNTLCTIDSAEPLPLETHNVILGLDRKMRLYHEVDENLLDEAEKKALLMVQDHYSTYPLPNPIRKVSK